MGSHPDERAAECHTRGTKKPRRLQSRRRGRNREEAKTLPEGRYEKYEATHSLTQNVFRSSPDNINFVHAVQCVCENFSNSEHRFPSVNSVTAPRRGKVSMTVMIEPPQEAAVSSIIDA